MDNNNNKLVMESPTYCLYTCSERDAYVVVNKEYQIEELVAKELPKCVIYLRTAESILSEQETPTAPLHG